MTMKCFSVTLLAFFCACSILFAAQVIMSPACYGYGTGDISAEAEQTAQELRSSAGVMKIYDIDVGQGDSALLVFPDGSNMLIDTGTSSGGRDVANLLTRLQITKLNKVVLSHSDNDHDGGYGSLQSGGFIDSSTQRYDGYQMNNSYPGDTFYNNAGVTVTCVTANGHIIGGGYVNPGGDTNPASVGVLVSFRGFDYLSCGDLTSAVESPLGDALFARGDKIDVLKVDHHGSNTSTSLHFLQQIRPEFATISVGGQYGHPTQDTLNKLNAVLVQRIFQTEIGNGGTASNVTVANGQIVITTNGATYTFTNEGPGSTSFSYGPYQVDEPVYEEQPPHLMITEVGIGAHTFPENHDWVELYLPMDAQSIDLRSVYVTDLDYYVSPIATSAVTLMPGDVVILHDAPGQSENDATGKGTNKWWDLFAEFNGPGNTWNPYDDELVISAKNTPMPTQADIIDAVVWSNYDGSMFQDQADDGNYLINNFHWGDPTVGSGLFTLTNDGPAIGDIDNGYPQRITNMDTNSKGDWQISPTNSEGTPPPEPTPIPPPPPPIEVILNSSSLAAGEMLNVRVVVQPFTGRPFDAYAVIAGKAGTFSIQSGNRLRWGIIPIVQDIPALPKGYSGVLLNMAIPRGVSGDYRVVAGLVDAGGKVKGPGSAFAIDVEHLTVK